MPIPVIVLISPLKEMAYAFFLYALFFARCSKITASSKSGLLFVTLSGNKRLLECAKAMRMHELLRGKFAPVCYQCIFVIHPTGRLSPFVPQYDHGRLCTCTICIHAQSMCLDLLVVDIKVILL